MKLELNPGLGVGYRSRSQWARRVTEGWALDNLYCVACASDTLSAHVANRAVEDYHCPQCERQVQLKAKAKRIGGVVRNSAYEKKRQAIEENRVPDYCFLAYNREKLVVTDIVWVPSHFVTLSVIEKCKPLKARAQRAGWIGSNILLRDIAEEGKIPLVSEGEIVAVKEVRAQFRKLSFIKEKPMGRRQWLTDVLAVVDDLGGQRGDLVQNKDIMALAPVLAKKWPDNRHVEAKVRQQLQLLVAKKVLDRVAPGVYRRL